MVFRFWASLLSGRPLSRKNTRDAEKIAPAGKGIFPVRLRAEPLRGLRRTLRASDIRRQERHKGRQVSRKGEERTLIEGCHYRIEVTFDKEKQSSCLRETRGGTGRVFRPRAATGPDVQSFG